MVAMMAGADFIKTSTGKEDINATLPVSLVMTRAIREYRELTGVDVGFKPGGRAEDRQGRDLLAHMMKGVSNNGWEPDSSASAQARACRYRAPARALRYGSLLVIHAPRALPEDFLHARVL
jgi:deoxyribose-phosphate aldolase